MLTFFALVAFNCEGIIEIILNKLHKQFVC